MCDRFVAIREGTKANSTGSLSGKGRRVEKMGDEAVKKEGVKAETLQIKVRDQVGEETGELFQMSNETGNRS